MITLLLASTLYTSPQFCAELTEELSAAVVREDITQEQANDISSHCLKVYTEGA